MTSPPPSETERLLAAQLHGDVEEAGFGKAVIAACIQFVGGLFGSGGSTFMRNHVRASLFGGVKFMAFGVGTCGVGFLFFWPSFARWRTRARKAAERGEPIERW